MTDMGTTQQFLYEHWALGLTLLTAIVTLVILIFIVIFMKKAYKRIVTKHQSLGNIDQQATKKHTRVINTAIVIGFTSIAISWSTGIIMYYDLIYKWFNGSMTKEVLEALSTTVLTAGIVSTNIPIFLIAAVPVYVAMIARDLGNREKSKGFNQSNQAKK